MQEGRATGVFGRRITWWLPIALFLFVSMAAAYALLLRGGAGATDAGFACRSYPVEYPAASVTSTPNGGRPGDPVVVGLQDSETASQDHPAEAYLSTDTTLDPNEDNVLASGTISSNQTSAVLTGNVPGIGDGEYHLFVCWEANATVPCEPCLQNSYYKMESTTFLVHHGTATPSPTPTPTTPVPTLTQTPSPGCGRICHFSGIRHLLGDGRAGFLGAVACCAARVGRSVYIPPTDDVYVAGVEVTQGIQCFNPALGLNGATCPDNSLPLVEGKSTALRIYLGYTGSGQEKAGVPVRAYFFVDGQWQHVDTAGTARNRIDQGAPDNAAVWLIDNFDHALRFYIEVDPKKQLNELDETNNEYPSPGSCPDPSTCFITQPLYDRGEYNVLGWPMYYHPDGGPVAYADPTSAGRIGTSWVNRVWPTKNGGIHYFVSNGYFNWTIPLAPESGYRSDIIHDVSDDYLDEDHVFTSGGQTLRLDEIHVWTSRARNPVRGLSEPQYGGGNGIASIGSDGSMVGASVDNPSFDEVGVYAHEFGHNDELRHTATGRGCDDSTLKPGESGDWPYALPSIQEYGFNPDTGKIYEPLTTYDWMGYCASSSLPEWISPFHWRELFDRGGPPINSALQIADSDEMIVVRGTIDNPDVDGGQGGRLGTLVHLPALEPTPPSGTGYTVELRGPSGLLESQPFGVEFTDDDHVDHVLPNAHFGFRMHWVPEATSIVLLRGTTVLDTVEVSANSPTVQVTDPAQPAVWRGGSTHAINWAGSDADADPLVYSLWYAIDGQHFFILQNDIAGTSFEIPADILPGGAHARFRVVASDGINTSHADSAEVSVPNKPPLLAITNPVDGASVAKDGLVVFQGGATDMEDGPLPDADLHWSSDKDGELGSGATLPANMLSPGVHAITLQATDSNGASASQTIHITAGMGATMHIWPNAIDPAGSGDVFAYVTLPPGEDIGQIDTQSLKLHIGDAEIAPKATQDLGDPDEDGLPTLKLTFDGTAVRNALAGAGGQASAADTTLVGQVTSDLTGTMQGGIALSASDEIWPLAPGDVDCSAPVDMGDALEILRWVAGIGMAGCLAAGDEDCNGQVNELDALNVATHVAGLEAIAGDCPTSASVSAEEPAQSSSDSNFGLINLLAHSWLLLGAALPAVVVLRTRWR